MATKKRNARTKQKQPRRLVMPSKAQWRFLAVVMAALTVILGIAGVRAWLNNPANLQINNVEVVGDIKHVDAQTMREVIEPFTHTNLHLLDIESLERELEFEPWIRSVAITKLWPKSLVIEITEQQPVAFWGDDRMINNHGEIFDARLDSQEGIMPVLYSADDQGLEMIAKYRQLQQWMKGLPVGVSEFVEDARGGWILTLTNNIHVYVGREEQFKRIRRFVVGYRQALADKSATIARVDLRYTNGFAVAWR